MRSTALHHISIPVADVERSRGFYVTVLGLTEIERPPFPFPGAWFTFGDGQLHLIGDPDDPTYRDGKGVDPGDVHLAVRVASFRGALEHLEAQGYSAEADADDPHAMIVRPQAITGYPQIYIVDPDGHMIELNAERLD